MRRSLVRPGRVLACAAACARGGAVPPATFGAPRTPRLTDLQQGVLDLTPDVPNIRCESCAAEPHVRIGWFRSVYDLFHAFASGTLIDEIAADRGPTLGTSGSSSSGHPDSSGSPSSELPRSRTTASPWSSTRSTPVTREGSSSA